MRIVALYLLVATGCILRGVSSCQVLYSRLGSADSESLPDCGLSANNPCSTIAQALHVARATETAFGCWEVRLLAPSSGYYGSQIACERLSWVENVTVNAEAAGMLPLQNTTCSTAQPQVPWLSIVNSTNVEVQFLDVQLAGFYGWSAVSIEMSYNVSIVHSHFKNPHLNTTVIYCMNSIMVQVLGCFFQGEKIKNPFTEGEFALQETIPLYRLAAIESNRTCALDCACSASRNEFGKDCCSGPAELYECEDRTSLSIEDSSFSGLGIEPIRGAYVSSRPYEDASAINMAVLESTGFRGSIKNCTFSNNTSPFDSVVLLFSAGRSIDTQFLIADSTFSNGWGYAGGGIYKYTLPGSLNTSLTVSRCSFVNNTAYVQGGAIAFSENSRATGRSQHLNEGYNAADLQHKVYIDDCSFSNNKAAAVAKIAAGGCIAASSTQEKTAVVNIIELPQVRIRNSKMLNSTAQFGSTIYASHVHFDVANMLVQWSTGDSAVAMSGSCMTVGENITFLENQATNKGGGIALHEESLLFIGENSSMYFFNNSAAGYGGAIYADESSSTVSIDELLEFKSTVGLRKLCFIHADSNSSVSFTKPSAQSDNTTFTFAGNRAAFGQSLYANSYTACIRDQPELVTAIKDAADSISKPSEVMSGAVWLYFVAAGCGCVKPNPFNTSQYWVYLRTCKSSTIYNDSRISSMYIQEGYPELYGTYVNTMKAYFESAQELSGLDQALASNVFITPWAITTYEWFFPRKYGAQATLEDSTPTSESLQTYVSEISLYPAPGEMFPLSLKAADVFLQEKRVLVRLEVDTGPVLLIGNGRINEQTEVLMYCSMTPIIIGLAGKPGQTGTLKATVEGQITAASLMLIIPFRLRPCHFGFTQPYFMTHSTEKEMDDYVRSFTGVYQKLVEPGSTANNLICQCPSESKGVKSCSNGTDITVDWAYWAGDSNATKFYRAPEKQFITDLQAFEDTERSKKLLIAPCCCGFCTDHKQQPWQIMKDTPCKDSRKGPICGQCSGNNAFSLGWSVVCMECEGAAKILGRLHPFLIFLITGAYLLVFSYFDMGTSAVFESWVSYEQFLLFIVRRDLHLFSITKIDIGSCLNSQATVMAGISFQYFDFVMFLVWVALVYYASKLVVVRRFIIDNSLVIGLWALLSFTYVSLLYPSFTLLACHEFNGDYVLYSDASVKCFGHEHWPWGLMALCALVFIAMPLPLLLLTMRSNPRIKPLFDVYLSYVKDDKTWYIAYGLGRRILLCLVSVNLAEANTRQAALALIMQVYLFAHFLIMPYRKLKDNVWEAVFLSCACIFAMLNVISVLDDNIVQQLMMATYVIPAASALLSGIIKKWRKFVTLVEFLITLLISPFIITYCYVKGYKLRRFRFEDLKPVKGENSDNEEPMLPSEKERNKEVERAKEHYDLRDEFLLDIFRNN